MNYEKELNGFLEYAGHYDRTNGMIELKVVHTLRVAQRFVLSFTTSDASSR